MCARRSWWPYCYLPNPGPCTYTLPSNSIRLRLVPATSWNLEGEGPKTETPYNINTGAEFNNNATFNSSFRGFEVKYKANFDQKPKPFLDGDCRLKAPNSNQIFTGSNGTIAFDAIDWMSRNVKVNTSLGWQSNATRLRWMIKPSKPTKQIKITFDSMDLSSDQMHDMLYVLEDCNAFVPRNWLSDYGFDYYQSEGEGVHILNGLGKDYNFEYGAIEVPCPLTFKSSCIVIELDMAMRYANPDQYQALFAGFTITYTASNVEPQAGVAVKWQAGGPRKACMPAYVKVQSPPKFVWKELCCQQEPGNDVFGDVNFWGNLSIDPLIPPGEDEENFKTIYKVEPYEYDGQISALHQEVACDSDPGYMERLEGWYPSGPRMAGPPSYYWWAGGLQVDADWAINNWAGKAEDIPDEWIPQRANMSARLWYLSSKLVLMHGRDEIINVSSILLNAHKPSSDRDEMSNMYDHVLISAVTCRKYVSNGQAIWQKSALSQIDVKFATGPSISVALALPAVSNSLVKYNASADESQQIQAAKLLIDELVDSLAVALQLKDKLSAGALSRISVIDFSAAKTAAVKRRNYKAAQVGKPGYEPAAPPAPIVDESLNDLYDVNVTVSILCKSIQEVTKFHSMLSSASTSRRFSSITVQYSDSEPATPSSSEDPTTTTTSEGTRRVSLGASLSFAVQVPTAKQVGRGGSCLSHYDCTQSPAPLFCSKNKVCEFCRLCSIDQKDSIDNKCPRELCPSSGGFPACVSAPKLAASAQPCMKTYDFEVRRYSTAGDGNFTAPEVNLRVYVCMYVLMCVCMWRYSTTGDSNFSAPEVNCMCMYTCMHVCMCVCVCVCRYSTAGNGNFTAPEVIHVYVCMHVCANVCMYVGIIFITHYLNNELS